MRLAEESEQCVNGLLAQRLKAARTRRGLSRDELAAKIDPGGGHFSQVMCQAKIDFWENGDGEPSLENLRVLCRALRVSADHLLGLTDHVKRGSSKVCAVAEESER